MKIIKAAKPQPSDVLARIKIGLIGYVTYLAACRMNRAFSEYVLYEPILRILTARGFRVECEFVCPGIEHAAVGDKKKIDFYATKGDLKLAIEVKWAKSKKPKVQKDILKLSALLDENPNALTLLCVFGEKDDLEAVQLPETAKFAELGTPKIADLGNTDYGCRIFQLLSPAKPPK